MSASAVTLPAPDSVIVCPEPPAIIDVNALCWATCIVMFLPAAISNAAALFITTPEISTVSDNIILCVEIASTDFGNSAVLSGNVVDAFSVSVTFAKFSADRFPPAVTAATPEALRLISVVLSELLNEDA